MRLDDPIEREPLPGGCLWIILACLAVDALVAAGVVWLILTLR